MAAEVNVLLVHDARVPKVFVSRVFFPFLQLLASKSTIGCMKTTIVCLRFVNVSNLQVFVEWANNPLTWYIQ